MIKNDLALLRMELTSIRPELLDRMAHDIRRTKEEIDARVSRPLVDVETELDRRIADVNRQASFVPPPFFHPALPFTPTPLHPFPPLYLAQPWPPAGQSPFELAVTGGSKPSGVPDPPVAAH